MSIVVPSDIFMCKLLCTHTHTHIEREMNVRISIKFMQQKTRIYCYIHKDKHEVRHAKHVGNIIKNYFNINQIHKQTKHMHTHTYREHSTLTHTHTYTHTHST